MPALSLASLGAVTRRNQQRSIRKSSCTHLHIHLLLHNLPCHFCSRSTLGLGWISAGWHAGGGTTAEASLYAVQKLPDPAACLFQEIVSSCYLSCLQKSWPSHMQTTNLARVTQGNPDYTQLDWLQQQQSESGQSDHSTLPPAWRWEETYQIISISLSLSISI